MCSPFTRATHHGAGVGKMTRRLTVTKSFLRDFFNVEALDRGEHGRVYKCVCRMDLWPYAVKVIEAGCVSARRLRAYICLSMHLSIYLSPPSIHPSMHISIHTGA